MARKQNTFGDAFSCPHAEFGILQETTIVFKCPKCTWRREFEPNAVNEYSHIKVDSCFYCEHRNELKQYEIIDGKCKEIENG